MADVSNSADVHANMTNDGAQTGTEQAAPAPTVEPMAAAPAPAPTKEPMAAAPATLAQEATGADRKIFPWFMCVWQALMLLFMFLFTKYNDGELYQDGTKVTMDTTMVSRYGAFQDVHVMIFVGFGFLMTFLRKYGFSAVSYNFLISGFAIQWYILAGGFFHKLMKGETDGTHALESKIEINLVSLIAADFSAAVVLITFGGLLGKVSVTQMMIVTCLEIVFFSINEGLNLEYFKTNDMGGSVVLHTFGAYFGLAASWVLTPADAHENKDNSSTKNSDLFSMIGTLFLWMFWPSFNSAVAAPTEQQRIVVNTYFSIVGSLCAAFIASHELRGGKFNMVDIQNATLAGGVAIGAACNTAVGPGGALATGIVAGLLSTGGFAKLSPMLEKCGVFDTCGIHNLHGMPGVLAGIVGTIMAACATEDDYKGKVQLQQTFAGRFDKGKEVRTAGEQAGYQFGYLCVTLAISIVSGIITGYVCKFVEPKKTVFDDAETFDVPDETDLIQGWVEMASPSSRMLRRRKATDMDMAALDIES